MLTLAARKILERQSSKPSRNNSSKESTSHSGQSTGSAMSTLSLNSGASSSATHSNPASTEWLGQQYQAFLSRKRSLGEVDTAPRDPRVVQSRVQVEPSFNAMSPSAHAAATANLTMELDEFFNSIQPHAYVANAAAAYEAAYFVN